LERRPLRQQAGLAGLGAMVLLPLLWVWMSGGAGFALAAVASGVWRIGSIGYERQLNVDIVPPEKKTEYMALFYSWWQICGILSPIVADWGIDRAQGLQWQILGFPVGAYIPFFALTLLGLLGLLAGTAVFASTGRTAEPAVDDAQE
jgi:hypothetical protein